MPRSEHQKRCMKQQVNAVRLL